ncbi:MAG: hypothetical protein HYR60_05145 [Acidobacteria bacterium]|nr:hypothetical protein [Acidobacteriota bacterium]
MGGRVRWLLPILLGGSLQASTYYLAVAGLGGEPEFEQRFHGWTSELVKILKPAPDSKLETLEGPAATKANLRAALEKIAKESTAQDALVLMLIGHGSFDGADYKFNLPGPDISAIELASLLDRIPARQLVVNMTSCSGGGIASLHKENRVIVSATKSGTERNATVFARYWVEALRDGAADSDKNETISALEAFRYAEQKTTQFYETQKRLATEHAVLEDTGHGEGVRAPSPENGYGLVASAFPVLLVGAGAASTSPEQRKLLARKQGIEEQIDRLKYQKAAMPFEEYRKELGALVLELAKVQAELDK